MTTKTLAEIRRKYTRVVKLGPGWDTVLQIDHQGFSVVERATKARAQWYAKMLAIALERLLSSNTK